MEAQTQSTHERKKDNDPGTPVIIKTGGDRPPHTHKIPVTIESDRIFFTKFVQDGNVWVSHSTSKGRIHMLSIIEGPDGKTDDIKQPHPDLAEVKIEYGNDCSLVLREKGTTSNQDIVLEITSVGASFQETAAEWNSATDLFPLLTCVKFNAGNEAIVFRDDFETIPILHIHFHQLTDG